MPEEREKDEVLYDKHAKPLDAAGNPAFAPEDKKAAGYIAEIRSRNHDNGGYTRKSGIPSGFIVPEICGFRYYLF